jgi:hypothetical protein
MMRRAEARVQTLLVVRDQCRAGQPQDSPGGLIYINSLKRTFCFSCCMTAPDAIALAVALVSLTVVFIRLRREHQRSMARQENEPC